MKKILLLASAMLLLAGVANAQVVGLYADADHCVCTVGSAMYTTFDCWVWMKDDVNGIRACEYKLTPPPLFMGITTLNNPDINLTMQSWDIGITISFATCHMDWVWAQKVTFLNTNVTPVTGYIEISGRPDSEPYYLQSASCESGYPIYPLQTLNHLAINQPCVIGVEESSWGAIKSLF